MSHAVTAAEFESLGAGTRLQNREQSWAEAIVARRHVSPRIVAALVRIAEGLLVAVLGLIFWLTYPQDVTAEIAAVYLPVIMAASVLTPLMLQLQKRHTIHALTLPLENLAAAAFTWTAIFAGFAALVFFFKAGGIYSRFWLGAWYLSGLAGLTLLRCGVSFLVRAWQREGQLTRRAILVGGGEPAENLYNALKTSTETEVQIVGVFDDRGDERAPSSLKELPKLGNTTDLVDFVRTSRVDLLIVTLPITAENRLLGILKKLWILPVDIRLSAYSHKLRYRPRAYSYVGNVPLLDVFDKPLSDWGVFLKAAEDKIIAGIALAALAPVMLAIAAAVKLDSRGPVFFKQKRYGFNNEEIDVYKFRSMYTDRTDAQASKLVTKNDPRVTRVGRFIRKSSLDELPQLFNVLLGNLSLVGPRPHPTKAKAGNSPYDEVVEGYFARHRVKPGITGWAQINGWRGETDTEEKILRRVEHDLYYIENWSLALDMSILLRTPFALLNTENAY